ncbi:alpha/beta hydrolase [Ascidiimonas aurantiaca]|uniref:alpha/beta hydrolase n=1 Tax=Ascidiimonas aurantiaca TaxID=1685432 RepID=UPI0030EB3EBC
MKIFFSVLLLFFITNIRAQTVKETFESYKLNEKRELQIYIPENYSEEKTYPLIVVLDAEYLFDITVANTRFYSYWQEMPEAIVVGINQNYDNIRYEDCDYSDQNGMPQDKGNAFFEFIGLELVPYFASKYTLANFKVIIGHDVTANFSNYWLFKDNPLFDAYITLSPSFAPMMEDRLPERLSSVQNKKFYYLATSDDDIKENITRIKTLHQRLKQIENDNLKYYFDDLKGASHVSLPSYALPKALDQIFKIFKPISPEEYKKQILTMETPVFEYLENKYNTIETLFGFKRKVSLNDIMAIYAATQKKEDLPSLELLAKLSKKEYPETMLGFFFEAEYYEQMGEPKKALRTYEKAFGMPEIDFLTKDMMLDRIDALKADFGW